MGGDNEAYGQNSSFSFQGEPEMIDVEQEINDSAKNTAYDPHKLTEILVEIGQRMTGIHLYSYQKPICFRIIYSLLARDGAEVSALFSRQCIRKGSMVLGRDGKPCRIENHPDSWLTKKEEPIFEVTINGGYKIHATDNHPLFIAKKQNTGGKDKFSRGHWKEVKDIEEGDWAQVLISDDRFGNDIVKYSFSKYVNNWAQETISGKHDMNEELSELLGWMVADGTLGFNGQSAKFTNTNPKYLDRVEYLVKKYFPTISCTRYKKGNGFDILLTTKGNKSRINPFKDWLKAMEFDGKFPTALKYLSKKSVCAFFRGMYAADGYLSKIRKSYEIGLSCGNDEQFSKYCAIYLSKLGIHCSPKGEYMSKNVDGTKFYRLVFTGRKNLYTFSQTIGDVLDKPYPIQPKKVKDTKYTSEKYIGEDKEVLEYKKILSVKPCGVSDVYDMEVPDKHWFVCDGVKVHNSGKSEVVVFTVVTMGVLFPVLAKIYPKELGHFANGIKMGLLAPQYEQVDTIYKRAMERLLSEPVRMFLDDPDILDTPLSQVHFKLKSGSFLTGQSAAKQSRIESKTYHVIYLDESQDIDTEKVRRCVGADSIVYTNLGEVTVEEAVQKKLDIFSPSGGLVTPSNWFDNGVQETVKITLENGSTITTTESHKNRVIRRGRKDNKPFNLTTKSLQIKDRLSVIDKLPHFGTKYTYEDGVLCGYFLGDGCLVAGTGLKFYCFSETFDRLESLLSGYNVEAVKGRINKDNGLIEVQIANISKRSTGYRSNCKGANELINFFREVGIYGLVGTDKNISIQDKSIEFVKGLVEGLIETDGSIVLPEKAKGWVDFSNTSKGLVDTFQKSCHVLGVHGNIISFENNGSYSENSKTMYSIKIKDVRSINTLFEEVKLHEKQDKFAELLSRVLGVASRNTCKLYEDWERFYKIIKIEKVGVQKTYCVEMPTEDHLWVVNGINTHNSIIPMTASTFGTIVRTGTPSRNKGDFYYTIDKNKKHDKKLKSKKDIETKTLHYQYDYKQVIVAKKAQFKIDGKDFHMLYEKSVMRDKHSMGENSDYFRMAYKIEWLLEVGMFISEEGLTEHCFDKRIGYPTIGKDSFVVAGLDIASARADTILTIGTVDYPSMEFGERPQKVLNSWLVLSGLNYEEQFHIIVENLISNQVRVLFADYTGVGRALTDILMYHLSEYIEIVPYTFTPSSKSDMWKALDEDILNERITIPAIKSIRDTKEFRMFTEQMTNLQKYWRGSFLVCEKTTGFADDMCDSLGLMNLAGNYTYTPPSEIEVTENDLINTGVKANLTRRSQW